MSDTQKAFNRKLVKYDRSFFSNVPAKLLKLDLRILKLEVTIDKKTKLAKIKLIGGKK